MTEKKENWGALMKKERESIGMTIYEAARRLNMDWVKLQKMERGHYRVKPEVLVMALAEYQASIFTRERAYRWAKQQNK
jgi:ribosome-binding protein aMBF1 (putative translation factor)